MVEPQASLEESVVVEASPRWVTVQVSHGHKFRVGEWMERRFPGSERVGNGRDVVVYGAESPAAVVSAMRGDAHARRFVHAVTACAARVATSEAVARCVVALYDSAGAAMRGCKLVVHGNAAMKRSLIASLPERLDLRPRGHSHCVTVEPVIVDGSDGRFYCGLCAAADEFATDERVLASKRDDHAVSRAYFKLREARDHFDLGRALGDGAAVVDVGASPGGWSQFCLEAGAAAVAAVDPGDVDASLLADARLVHVRAKVEVSGECLAAALRGAGKGSFDACVCDANAHPAAALRLLAPAVCPLLRPGAALPGAFGRAFGQNQKRSGQDTSPFSKLVLGCIDS